MRMMHENDNRAFHPQMKCPHPRELVPIISVGTSSEEKSHQERRWVASQNLLVQQNFSLTKLLMDKRQTCAKTNRDVPP